MLEHSVQTLSSALAHHVHSLGAAIAHPGAVLESCRNLSASLPHNMTAGLNYIYHSLAPATPNASAEVHSQAADLWRQAENVMQYMAGSSPGAVEANLPSANAPVALSVWLRDVVSKSVMWPVPRLPLLLFMAGAMACLAASALCHLLASTSHAVAKRIWRLDYAGAPCTTPSCLESDGSSVRGLAVHHRRCFSVEACAPCTRSGRVSQSCRFNLTPPIRGPELS
jgi:Haemolysin-III related